MMKCFKAMKAGGIFNSREINRDSESDVFFIDGEIGGRPIMLVVPVAQSCEQFPYALYDAIKNRFGNIPDDGEGMVKLPGGGFKTPQHDDIKAAKLTETVIKGFTVNCSSMGFSRMSGNVIYHLFVAYNEAKSEHIILGVPSDTLGAVHGQVKISIKEFDADAKSDARKVCISGKNDDLGGSSTIAIMKVPDFTEAWHQVSPSNT